MGRLAELFKAFDTGLAPSTPVQSDAPRAQPSRASEADAHFNANALRTPGSRPPGLGTPVEPPSSTVPQNAEELLHREGIRFEYVTTLVAAERAVQALTSADGPIGFDIECAKLQEHRAHPRAGLHPPLSRIRLVQFFAGGDVVYVFDIDAIGLPPLSPLWVCPLVAHNAVFELKHLLHANVFPDNPDCTLLAANALDGSLPRLADLALKHLGWGLSKDLQTSDWNHSQLSPAQLAYAALDAVVTRKVWRLHSVELTARRRLRCYELMKRAQPTIANLELRGLHFDCDAHTLLCDEWEETLRRRSAELLEALGPDINPASPKQIADWLQRHVDQRSLARWPRTASGQLQTNAAALKRFSENPLVGSLLAYKEAQKLVSTFGRHYREHRDPVTGRIHSSFRIGGTATGRISSRVPNVQNVPRDPQFRALFTAPPGRRLIVADFDQMELRVAALVSKDDAMLDAYDKGVDLHRKTAAAITGLPLESITAEHRQTAKPVNFGLVFGMGAQGLTAYAEASFGVRMPISEARTARARFLSTYPGLVAWQRRISKKAAATMRVVTPGERVRDFRKEPLGYRYTEALNTPIQGGAAEVMLATLARLPAALAGLDAFPVNTVHDEILVEAGDKDALEVRARVENAMIAGMLEIFPSASTKGLVASRVVSHWGEGK